MCGDECLFLHQQCNGTCPGERIICGDECIDKDYYEDYYGGSRYQMHNKLTGNRYLTIV